MPASKHARAVDKQELLRALVRLMEDELARATELANRTREGATHEEARPENDKDTRALEQSYLARGQAERVVELEADLKRVRFMDLRSFGEDDAIALSALVKVEAESEDGDAERARWYFLTPAGGGRKLEAAGLRVDVLTPQAPLGRALIGRLQGDDVQLRVGAQVKELVIAEVC